MGMILIPLLVTIFGSSTSGAMVPGPLRGQFTQDCQTSTPRLERLPRAFRAPREVLRVAYEANKRETLSLAGSRVLRARGYTFEQPSSGPQEKGA